MGLRFVFDCLKIHQFGVKLIKFTQKSDFYTIFIDDGFLNEYQVHYIARSEEFAKQVNGIHPNITVDHTCVWLIK